MDDGWTGINTFPFDSNTPRQTHGGYLISVAVLFLPKGWNLTFF
jgi:hypothetical protein